MRKRSTNASGSLVGAWPRRRSRARCKRSSRPIRRRRTRRTRRLNLPAAWDVTTGSPGVVIAIVDTGIDPSHPDLVGAVRVGRDFVDRDDDATNPPGGHGTAVAGVAAARANNGIGGIGTLLLVRRSCRSASLGLDGIALNTDTAAAIDYAVDQGAAVVNASIYGPHAPPTLRQRSSARALQAFWWWPPRATRETARARSIPPRFPRRSRSERPRRAGSSPVTPASATGSSSRRPSALRSPRSAEERTSAARTSVCKPARRGDRGAPPHAGAIRDGRRARERHSRRTRAHSGKRSRARRCRGRARRARAARAAPATGGRRRADRRRVARGVHGRVVGCGAHGNLSVGALPRARACRSRERPRPATRSRRTTSATGYGS